MKPRLFVLLLAAVALSPLHAQEAGDAVEKKAALDAITPWLQEIDQDQYEPSWREGSKLLQQTFTVEQWQSYVEGLRGSLGKNLQRTPGSVLLQNGPPPLPASAQPAVQPDQPGAYLEHAVAQFDASFENLKYAVETVVFVKGNDGTWRAVSYTVKAKTTAAEPGST